MTHKKDILYANTEATLSDLCAALANSPWVALDTEFLRENTYFPEFCLLQVSTPRITACVDPLLIENLDPLFELLYSPSIIKVFHSARQDLEIFYYLRGSIPGPLFDTQVAAPLLGYAEQPGYATLVAEILKVQLSKAYTRTDWTHRPLSPAQIRYAADDVIYLGQLYENMHTRLNKLGRLHWLEQEFEAMMEPALYQTPPDIAWQRIRAANRLRGTQLSILQTLADWRERTAIEENKPRGWLLKDNALIDLARLAPSRPEELKLVRSLGSASRQRYGKQLCQLIAEAQAKPPQPARHSGKTHSRSSDQEALIDLLMAVVRMRAAEHSLNPASLTSKKDLESLLNGEPTPILQSWRKSIVGDELLAILQGEKNLSVQNHRLEIESRTHKPYESPP